MKKIIIRLLQAVLVLALLFFAFCAVSGSDGRGVFIAICLVIAFILLCTFRIPLGGKTNAVSASSPVRAGHPAPKQPEPRIRSRFLPNRINGAPIAYEYSFPIVPAEGLDIVADVLRGEEKLCDMVPSGDDIELQLDGQIVARIHNEQKARMTADWARNGRAMKARITSGGKLAQIAYYDDPRPRNSFREQTVVELVNYKGASKQDASACLEPGDPLELDDDENGRIFVTYRTEEIGMLPKAITNRIDEEGEPWKLFIEEIRLEESDSGDDIYRPVVRIFW